LFVSIDDISNKHTQTRSSDNMFNIRKGNQYYDYRCYMNNDANGR